MPMLPEVSHSLGSQKSKYCAAHIWCCPTPVAMIARPLVCRLFPFTYDAAGLHADPGSSCPAHLLKPNESLLAHLNMSLETARIWHRMLYEEILHDGNHHRLDLRSAL